MNKFYIFGAHSRAQTTAVYLKTLHPDWELLGFLVDDEEENMKKLIFYIENNFDAKAVDDHIGDIDEGQKFFVRTAYLRRDLKEMFPDLSDGFIDNFIDENFDKIFD